MSINLVASPGGNLNVLPKVLIQNIPNLSEGPFANAEVSDRRS